MWDSSSWHVMIHRLFGVISGFAFHIHLACETMRVSILIGTLEWILTKKPWKPPLNIALEYGIEPPGSPIRVQGAVLFESWGFRNQSTSNRTLSLQPGRCNVKQKLPHMVVGEFTN